MTTKTFDQTDIAIPITTSAAPDHQTTVAPKSGSIRSLDGIRAFAFMAVAGAHAGHGNGGMIGVTIFFFLSGFLITTLLRREFDKFQDISLGKFYNRRVLRIFPPLYITLFVIGILAIKTNAGASLPKGPFAAAALFFENYWSILHGPQKYGLNPFWSLAVEEHFYLVFPLVFVFLKRKGFTYRQCGVAFAGICVLVMALRFGLSLKFPELSIARIDFGTDTRIDSILWGCILALVANPVMDSVRIPRSYGIVAIAALFGTSFIHNHLYRMTFHYTLQGILLFPIFFCAIYYDGMLSRILNFRWLRELGALSYSLYLVHLSFILAAEQFISIRSVAVSFALCASLAYALLMRVYVENPLMKIREMLRRG